MNKDEHAQQSADYRRIEKAIRFLEANFRTQPTLDQIADSVALSRYHFDRLFKRWAGISPIQFLHFLTLDYTKQRLAQSQNLLDTALEAGMSGPSRLHDLFVTFEAMTPGDFKRQGAGVQITYGFYASPFGQCLMATTRRGICYLGFAEPEKDPDILNQLLRTWPGAKFNENHARIGSIAKQIFRRATGKSGRSFHLQLKGTNFQINVWKALLDIPEGYVVSYQDIASHIGHPKAFRAVAGAVAVNPVAYLIPCHRVIAKTGKIHQYRWGSARKKALLGWEAAQSAGGRSGKTNPAKSTEGRFFPTGSG